MTKCKQKLKYLHMRTTRQSFFKIQTVAQMQYLRKQAETVFLEAGARQLVTRFYRNLQVIMVFSCSPFI